MVRESRIIAGLLMDDVTQEQWNAAIRVENILQKRTPASAKRQATAIRKRLEFLAPDFWHALGNGDDELATQVALCGVLERNLLLVEFMETVLRDAYMTRSEKIATYQWVDFLEERSYRDPDIGCWKESTRKKTGQVVFRILAEAGYLKSTRNCELQHVVLRPEVKTMLENHYKHRIMQCMEVSSLTSQMQHSWSGVKSNGSTTG